MLADACTPARQWKSILTEGYACVMQIQEHLEGPIGMALYEWKDGKIGNVCVQGGLCGIMLLR